MVFNIETLEDALERIGNLDNRDFILLVWTDVAANCKPIVKAIRLTLPVKMKLDICKDIFRGINSKVWILAIIDEHRNIYRITKAEEFAKKSCGGVLKDVKEREKGKKRKK